jgi:outer membrane protein assembly factor BamB
LNTNRFLLAALVLLSAVLLSGCASGGIGGVNWPGLSADAEKAYVADGQFVYAVDLKDGTEAWRYPASGNNKHLFYAPPVLTPDGQLLVGSAGSEHVFLSLDPATGKEKWASPFLAALGTWIAAPLVFNDLIYAPNSDGVLYILDLDGNFVDSIELGGSLWSRPVTDGTLVYVASLDHHLHVIDPATHKSVNTVDLGGAIPGGPTADTDGVYVGSFTGKMEFVSAKGSQVNLAKAKDWIWGAPALEGGTLYYADLSGRVYSLDLASGRQNWAEVQPDGPIAASPLVEGDRIVVAVESGAVLALDQQGKTVWKRELGGKIYSSLIAAGDLILVAPYQAEFLFAALDTDGKLAWTFTPEKK